MTKEFIKESEARILIFLKHAANHMKNGGRMSEKLEIDYAYMIQMRMELLMLMRIMTLIT